MSHFIETFKQGQQKKSKGLSMGPGLANISKAINGLQRKMMYAIASSPKVGKSTFVQYGFIIQPYLYMLEHPGTVINWIFYSWEMDRVSMEFDFCVYFLYHDFGVYEIELPQGVTVDGKNTIVLSSSYLMGTVQDDNGEIVLIDPDLIPKIQEVYANRIVPLFGEYAVDGTLLKKGYITFIEAAENPTGIFNETIRYASKRGTFHYEKYMSGGAEKNKIVGYTPNNPDEYVFVILDTIRKVSKERGFNMKETVDKTLEYETILRKMLGYSFVNIVHLNRDMADIDRLKFMGDLIYPQPELIKDTGNISEESTHVFTLFNPNDVRYNLKTHFGLKLRDSAGNELYPYLRTVHLVECRNIVAPQHFSVNMNGAIKDFQVFNR